MTKILTIFIIFTLISAALSCNALCTYCDFNYGYCYSCTDNAYLSDISNCTCYVGYHQFGSACVYDGSSGLAVWAIVLIALGNFVVVVCIIACIVGCIRRRRQRMYGAYNRFGEPVPVIQPIIPHHQPAYGNPTRPVNQPYNNPTRPTRPINQSETIPTGIPANPYVPSNPYVPQAMCQICMQGNCDCQTSCGHPSHRACLDRWTYPTCPTCGSTIPELKK